MKKGTIAGPAVFIAQGFGKKGWTTLEECAASAKALGYKGMQLPLWIGDLIDLERASTDPAYCAELQKRATDAGCPIVEVANHIEWQLVRCCPAYFALHKGFAPEEIQNDPTAVAEWAKKRACQSIATAKNFGFDKVGGFSGTSIFHLIYPWPQRPKGLVIAAFHALADAWRPIFDYAEEVGVDVCFELHPGEDLMDGNTFNRFLRYVDNHPRCCILLDLSHSVLSGMYMSNMLQFIRDNADRIKMFHVKDGEFNPTSGGGVYDGYQGWPERAARFRSTGDGQINYAEVFEVIRECGLNVWAVLEWEDCAGKGWSQGVREGALYIQAWMDGTEPPAPTEAEPHGDGAFDDFAATGDNTELIAEILGIPVDEVNVTEPPVVVA